MSEVEETENDDEEHADAEDDGGDPGIEDIIRSEAEALAAELDEAVEQGLDASTLQEIEETVENAAEALITMKEARTKLQEVKKDRGYGRAGTGGEGASRSARRRLLGNTLKVSIAAFRAIGQVTLNAPSPERDWAESPC